MKAQLETQLNEALFEIQDLKSQNKELTIAN